MKNKNTTESQKSIVFNTMDGLTLESEVRVHKCSDHFAYESERKSKLSSPKLPANS
jgi:hypothetical protein